MVGHARVVGLGRTTHGAHELSAITLRILRLFVEQLGFRTLAIEQAWTGGILIDQYLQTGTGNPRALLAETYPHYRTEEFLDVLCWMRAYNERHPADPLRFAGIDISGVGALAYNAVADYIRRAAPGRLDELEAHYAALRPDTGIDEHTAGYRRRPDKQPLIDHARQAYELVAGLAAGDDQARALQNARAITGYYELHAIDSLNSMSFLEARLAENVVWWHENTGHKVMYWSGSHSFVGHDRSISFPPAAPKTGRNAGSYLREYFGPDYVSAGLTFHHGAAPAPDSSSVAGCGRSGPGEHRRRNLSAGLACRPTGRGPGMAHRANEAAHDRPALRSQV